MRMLDFKDGKMYLKHKVIMMSYETFMPEKAKQVENQLWPKR